MLLQRMQAWLEDATASGLAKDYSSTVPGWASMQETVQQALQLLPASSAGTSHVDASASSEAAGDAAVAAACQAALRAVQLWAQGVHAASRTPHLVAAEAGLLPVPHHLCAAAWLLEQAS